MKKVLIIDDSKFICTFLSKKIQELFEISVDTVNSFEAAKNILLENEDYFLVLMDSNLADIDSIAAVDYLSKFNILTMIMVDQMTDEINTMFNAYRNIVDIVLKQTPESLNYISSLVSRLYQNSKTKVLVIDDSKVVQKQLKLYLDSQLYEVIIASNPIEGLKTLEKNSDIKIVVVDYYMPNFNGVELMKIIRRAYTKNKISIIGVSTDSQSSIEFLKNGANDFIKKPFTKEEFTCRINNSAEALENIQKIQEMANIDFLTKVSNRKYFFEKAEIYHEKIKSSNASCAIAMIDIDNFKSVNDTYGHGVGDDVIKELASLLRDNIKGQDIVARFGGEEFVLFLQDIPPKSASSFLTTICEKISKCRIKVSEDKEINFTVSIGVVTDKYDILNDKINAADELLYVAKNSGKNRVVDDIKEKAIPA